MSYKTGGCYESVLTMRCQRANWSGSESAPFGITFRVRDLGQGVPDNVRESLILRWQFALRRKLVMFRTPEAAERSARSHAIEHYATLVYDRWLAKAGA